MRRALVIVAVVAAAMTSGGAAVVAAPQRAAAQQDWSRTIVATPAGGFRMGKANAPVKLVEYGSLTCSHCAAFMREGVPALMPEIRSGRVSLEFRNFILNPADVAASLIARCAGPRGFFTAIDRMYATQEEWLARAAALPTAEAEAMQKLPPAQIVARYGEIIRLRPIAAAVHISPARERACLADGAAIDRLMAMREEATKLGVRGTPSFSINGALLDRVSDWATLKPHIAAGS